TAANERCTTQVTAVLPQEIEGGVVQVAEPGHQAPEVVLTGVVDREHLAVQYGGAHVECLANERRQSRESPEDGALSGVERRVVTVDVEHPAEPVELRLEQPIGIVERHGPLGQNDGCDLGERDDTWGHAGPGPGRGQRTLPTRRERPYEPPDENLLEITVFDTAPGARRTARSK